MGYANAQAVFTFWPHLPPRAKLIAVQMALIAHDPRPDSAELPEYWAGLGPLARALGRAAAPPGPTDRRVVRYALADLLEAGLVERISEPGKHGRYRLHLQPPPTVDKSG
ncbi:MAG: hypothetical protein GX632_00690 [Propioniciclava sp.]|nr:hypothetical protein [Propioniciclava sp.]